MMVFNFKMYSEDFNRHLRKSPAFEKIEMGGVKMLA